MSDRFVLYQGVMINEKQAQLLFQAAKDLEVEKARLTAELAQVKAERDALKLTGRKLNPVIRERDALAAELAQVKAELAEYQKNYPIVVSEWHDFEEDNRALRRANEALVSGLKKIIDACQCETDDRDICFGIAVKTLATAGGADERGE